MMMTKVDAPQMTHSIRISALRKSYGKTEVLKGIDIDVPAGTYLCLLGPSGCGKTTLLRAIAGLEHPDTGTLEIQGRQMFSGQMAVPVPPEKRGLGMVFQHYALWPHMKVRDNIAFPLRQRGAARDMIDTRVSDLADLIGLRPLLERFPGQLSGGQQQRVALARALCAEPQILLLDEPLSNLDSGLRKQLRRELRNIHDRLGMTSVMVTHDQEEAMALADKVAVLFQGEVVQYGPPEEVLNNPATRYVAGFVGYDNMLEVTALPASAPGQLAFSVGADSATIQCAGPVAPGTTVALGLKSDALRLVAPGSAPGLDARITRVTRLGPTAETEITVAGQPLMVAQPVSAAELPREGSQMTLRLPERAPVLP